jgi:hypothetical protein
MKKNVMKVFLLLFVTGILVSQETPQVVDNTIRFLDGETTIQIGINDSYYIFPNKNRLVYVMVEQEPNLGVFKLQFYDFHGRNISQPRWLVGAILFVFSETAERILGGNVSRLTWSGVSILYDLDGNIINRLPHDNPSEAKQIGITDDERYFWFAFERRRGLEYGENSISSNWPRHYVWNQIMIFDVQTGNFVTEFSTQDSPFSFTLNGVRYIIPVSLPGSRP